MTATVLRERDGVIHARQRRSPLAQGDVDRVGELGRGQLDGGERRHGGAHVFDLPHQIGRDAALGEDEALLCRVPDGDAIAIGPTLISGQ